MRILPLMMLVACVVCEVSAQEDGENRPAPTRGLLKRGLLAKGKQTTTTTTPPPQEEVEYEDDVEYAEGEAQEPPTEAPPSSTEGKKLVAGGVRPFRSNTDLLEALKRRRAQAAEAKLHGNSNSKPAAAAAVQAEDSPVEAPAPSKASYSKKRFNNAPKESHNEESAASNKPSRGRFGRPSSRSIQEDHEEQNESAPAPTRVGRTFARRAN